MSRPKLRPLVWAWSVGALLLGAGAWADALPTPEGELIPDTEAQDTAAMIAAFHAQIQKRFDTEGHAFRGAHRKAHGCVQSTFTVLPHLPPELAQGIFAKARAYNAVIRFSNGSPDSLEHHPLAPGLGGHEVLGQTLR